MEGGEHTDRTLVVPSVSGICCIDVPVDVKSPPERVHRYPGLVMNAVVCTMSVAAALIGAFTANMLEVNDRFRNITMLGFGGLMIAYAGSFVARLYGANAGFMFSGPMALGCLGAVLAVLAASCLPACLPASTSDSHGGWSGMGASACSSRCCGYTWKSRERWRSPVG